MQKEWIYGTAQNLGIYVSRNEENCMQEIYEDVVVKFDAS